MKKEFPRIIFMGTPDFAVGSLKILVENQFNIVAVITSQDKPAGRGLEMHQSAVKKYALEKNIKVLQPEKLKNAQFLNELKELKADLQIVVAFRMLPEEIWSMPKLGTFNLHGSLLPNYRGAAPINWAIINGEKETGVTTFFIEKEIDTGNIIFNETISILENDNAGIIHDKLMEIGAHLVLKTVETIASGNVKTIKQSDILKEIDCFKLAPKINKEDCRINWTQSLDSIHNFIRGLSPYPGAWTEIKDGDNKTFFTKIYSTLKENINHNYALGKIVTDQKKQLKIAVTNGFIHILEIQLAGKKKLKTEEFLKGFLVSENAQVN